MMHSAIRWIVLFLASKLIACQCHSVPSVNDIQQAINLLQDAGFVVCSNEPFHDIDLCDQRFSLRHNLARRQIKETHVAEQLLNDEEEEVEEAPWYVNLIAAFFCVSIAAVAAGLTLGMLALDPLMLLIKERAGETKEERQMASVLLPIVKQHHRLLVTLLLMNSIANEALPIFLEALVPSSVAILLSVTMVLFFGEIIPSAIFTGPNQLKLAHRLVPVVRLALFLLYPIAEPIARILDCVLQHDDEDSSGYNRGELSALIRINYEQRLAQKRNKRVQRDNMSLIVEGERVGALDFTPSHQGNSLTSFDVSKSIRAAKSQLMRDVPIEQESLIYQPTSSPLGDRKRLERSPSIHLDEVMMIEGALQMKTKVALDVYTPLRRVFSVPIDMELSDRNLVKIYASGYTRIPVHAPGDKAAICGLLITKQLIVVSGRDKRPLRTLPLRIPTCVSPTMPLVNLLNLLQTGGEMGKGGHMALVCAKPDIGNRALALGEEIPETSGLMGIVTLEDVLEALLQEQIYDESDIRERAASRIAKVVLQKWRHYVKAKKSGSLKFPGKDPALLDVVEAAIAKEVADEKTSLL